LETEKLKAKNRLLEAEIRTKQMEIDFLKKLEEIERRRFYEATYLAIQELYYAKKYPIIQRSLYYQWFK
jgi:hypothetical protein